MAAAEGREGQAAGCSSPTSSSSSSQADPGSACSAGPATHAAAAPAAGRQPTAAATLAAAHRLTTPPPLGHSGRGMGGAAPTPFNLAALGHAADIQRVAEAMAANCAAAAGV